VWVLSDHGRQYLWAEEKDCLTHFNPKGGHRIPPADCVVELQQAFRERFTLCTLEVGTEDLVAEAPFHPDDLTSVSERTGSSVARGVTGHLTQITQCRMSVTTLVRKQELLTPIECVNRRLDLRAFHIACKEIQSQVDSPRLPETKKLLITIKTGYSLHKFLMHQQVRIVTGTKCTPWVQHGLALHGLHCVIHQLGQAKQMSSV
jgi:hypothetical protein